jgi:hypothetical protein
MPEGTTFTDIHRKFRDNPDLYRYICALDLYIDELEGALGLLDPIFPLGDENKVEENQEKKPEKEPYKSKFQRKLDEAIAKSEEARKDRLKDTYKGMKD